MQYGRRNIVDGSKYNRFFGKPEETRKVVGDNSTEYNVSKLLPKWVAQCNWQTRKIADYLWDSNLEKFCHNIWKFLFSHIQYEYDDTGREQFRSPYRSWADRERGIDCDCFSIFVSCILTNKGIPHYFRITKYNGRDQWQHIYVIVPKRGVKFDPYDGDTYYTIDCVIHEFDTEKEFTDQKLQPMNGLGIITETLAGVEEPDAAEVLIGSLLDDDNELAGSEDDTAKLQLLATRNWVAENKELYEAQNKKSADDFVKMCDYALQYWDDPQKREKAIDVLAENEKMQEAAIKGLGTPQLRKQVFTKRIAMVKAKPAMKVAASKNVAADIDSDDFDGLGKSKAERKAARQKRKEVRAEKKKIRKEARKEAKQERKERRKANREERKQAKGFWNKLKVGLKQAGKAIAVSTNPGIIAGRGGFLLVLKHNLFNLAKTLHPAYCDEATAKKMGYTAKQIEVAKKKAAKTEDIFVKKLGGTKAHLKSAVLQGYLKKTMSVKGLAALADEVLNGTAGLGWIATAATIASALTAAISIVTALIKAFRKVDEDEGVETDEGIEGLGSIDGEIRRAQQLLQTTSINDIVKEMKVEGLSGDDKAETAKVFANFIKKIIAAIGKAKKNKKANGTDGAKSKKSKKTKKAATNKKSNKTASADSSATDNTKQKGKFGEKVKNFVGKAKDFVQDKLAERQNIQQMQDEYASSSFDNGFSPSSNAPIYSKSINTNSNNMGNEQKKGLSTGAKIAIGIGAAALVGGGIFLAVRNRKKKSEAALQGWATRRRNSKKADSKKLQTVNL